ncbi:MAG: flavin-containing monooxygenase [Porticoccaceae bacterium]
MTSAPQTATDSPKKLDVLIVGAGFAGMYLVHKFRKLGYSMLAVDAAPEVGGTWYWNRYPGARCDVESLQYSYSFSEELETEWEWSEKFAAQPEIHAYQKYVADKFDLRKDMLFNTKVTSAIFNDDTNRWLITTDQGQAFDAKYCVMATGPLSVPLFPKFEGMENFKGKIYHTGKWPQEEVDFSGQRVGVIGTGSSAVQTIPEIAKQTKELYIFQRTANYSVPAQNRPLTEEEKASWKNNFRQLRKKSRTTRVAMLHEFGQKSALEVSAEEREKEYQRRWEKGGTNFGYAYNDIILNEEANKTCADFVRRKIDQIVKDPKTAELLKTQTYPIATKRLCIDTDFYETFNKDYVHLVDVRSNPIERFTENGLTVAGKEYCFDSIILATGFDAMTGAVLNIDIRGKEGLPLKEKWEAGPRTYLGLQVAGFPNLFMVNAPGSPSVFTNMVISIEDSVNWITDCIANIDKQQYQRIEASEQAEEEWVHIVNEAANKTLVPKANSWYLGANVPGKTRVFMPYVGGFDKWLNLIWEIAEKNYEGFELSK